MSCCYIIYSKTLNRFYIGVTQDSIIERLERHNLHLYGGRSFTSKASDWELYLIIETKFTKQAIAIERHIKKMKSKIYIENLKKHPEIIEKLKSTYGI